MKVSVDGKLYGRFKEVLRGQGHEIVDPMSAELIIAQNKVNGPAPVFGALDEMPRAVLEAMNIGFQPQRPDFYVAKFFSGQFRKQTLIVIELPNLLGDDCGPEVSSGSLTGFVRNGPKLEQFFSNPTIQGFVSSYDHIGFVSIGIKIVGTDPVPCSLAMGLPRASVFGLMESFQTDLPAYFFGTDQDLFESWASSLLISRWPWPIQEHMVEVKGLTPPIYKHFWHSSLNRPVRDSLKIMSGIGFITAWADNPREACRRAVRTARNIQFDLKQYRTDLYVKAYDVIQTVETTGLATLC